MITYVNDKIIIDYYMNVTTIHTTILHYNNLRLTNNIFYNQNTYK